MIDQSVRAEICGVHPGTAFRPHRHRGIVVHRHAGQAVPVEEVIGHRRRIAGGILNLHAAAHQYVIGGAVEIEGVAPALLLAGQSPDLLREEEDIVRSAVPAAAGREKIVILSEIYRRDEQRTIPVRLIVERIRTHKHRIGVHIDIADEFEEAEGVEVTALVALDYLAVGASHRGPSAEDGHAVLGIVVEFPRAEHILLLVPQLHHRPSELGEVSVYQIVEGFARKLRIALDHPHVALAVDDIGILAPDRAVAHQIGPVVQKGGIDGPPDEIVPDLKLFDIAGAHQAQQRISLPGLFLRGQRICCGEQQAQGRNQSSFLIFRSHPLRLKSQSPNIGSMTIYVTSILSSTNLSTASICRLFFTRARSSV